MEGKRKEGGRLKKERKTGKLVVGFGPNCVIVTGRAFQVSLAK